MPKIKIFHILSKENLEVIVGSLQLIDVDVLDSEEAAENASIYHYGSALEEEYWIGLVGEGITEEVEDMQKALKSSSLSSYMLKHSHLLTHGFENNKKEQDNILKAM